MMALTLTQPWATLVALGEKRVETRSWRPGDERQGQLRDGLLAIHAGMGLAPAGGAAGLATLFHSQPFRRALADHGISDPGMLPRGRVVAVVEVAGWFPTEWAGRRGAEAVDPSMGLCRMLGPNYDGLLVAGYEMEFGDYTPGRWGWLFRHVWPVTPPLACAHVQADGTLSRPGAGARGVYQLDPAYDARLRGVAANRPLYVAPWRCVDCGRRTQRYDHGDACEPCVMQSFAEHG